MAGLTLGGFVPDTFETIKERIESRLEVYNPGFDFSPDSPDGQLIGVMTFEIAQAWAQLNNVYNSYNPQVASGAALRNLGLITGLPYGVANRSSAILETQGVTGTIIPRNSLVTDAEGVEFYTSFPTTIPSNLQVVAVVPGTVPVPAGTITVIKTPVDGWSGITQTTDGVEGGVAQTEQQYRNFRQRTVMRNYTSSVDTMQARLLELGLGQAYVSNNVDSIATLPDGTTPNTIQVVVGELGSVNPVDVANVILDTNAIGCPTFGNTSEILEDDQGVATEVFFSIAAPVSIEVTLDVTYLSDNTAGASENITTALFDHINSLLSDEDVIWSRLFGYITPYAKAQVNSLTIAVQGDSHGIVNIPINSNQFANILVGDISLTVDGVAP